MFKHILEQIFELSENGVDYIWLDLIEDGNTSKLEVKWDIGEKEFNKHYLVRQEEGQKIINRLNEAIKVLDKLLLNKLN
jgi:hypothetical protein